MTAHAVSLAISLAVHGGLLALAASRFMPGSEPVLFIDLREAPSVVTHTPTAGAPSGPTGASQAAAVTPGTRGRAERGGPAATRRNAKRSSSVAEPEPTAGHLPPVIPSPEPHIPAPSAPRVSNSSALAPDSGQVPAEAEVSASEAIAARAVPLPGSTSGGASDASRDPVGEPGRGGGGSDVTGGPGRDGDAGASDRSGGGGAGAGGRGGTGGGGDGGGRGAGGGDGTLVAALVPGNAGDLGAYYHVIQRHIRESLEYPPVLARRRISGSVEVELLVRANGEITDVHVASPASHPLLERAAIEALRAMRPVRFPADLAPRPLRVRVPVVFDLR
jgi:TonB family protein